MKITKRHYAEALKLANRARKALGKKPVTSLKKGKPGVGTTCAIAMTIGEGLVDVQPLGPTAPEQKITVYDENGAIPIVVGGKLANEFALAFDDELIPELIAS